MHNQSLAQPYSKITDITRTSRKTKSFCLLTQSHQDTNPHFHGDKDLWYIPMPLPVPLIGGRKGEEFHHSLFFAASCLCVIPSLHFPFPVFTRTSFMMTS